MHTHTPGRAENKDFKVWEAEAEREMDFPVLEMDSASETRLKNSRFWLSDQCSGKASQVPYKHV